MKKFFFIVLVLLALGWAINHLINRTIVLKNHNDIDIFTVTYRQPICGYKVEALVETNDNDINNACLKFTKDSKSFTLYTSSFGDTIFNKGVWGVLGENTKIMNQFKNQNIEADYNETPFIFKDMDFDDIEELVIVHYTMAPRGHNGYDVYRIVEGQLFPICYPPYNNNKVHDWGMTDYPEFDYKAKTISCPYPEGEEKYDGRIIYGISKNQKDTIIVNGHKHLFNHIEKINEVKY